MTSFIKTFFVLIAAQVFILVGAFFFSGQYPTRSLWEEMDQIREEIANRDIALTVGDSLSFERHNIQIDISRPYDLSYPYKLAKYDINLQRLNAYTESESIWDAVNLYVEMADLKPYQDNGLMRVSKIERRKEP